MLKLLSIANLAVVSQTQIEFGNGLNILSGETGSGKSIILAALGLLLGERASQDMLRTGESKANVEGVFDIDGNTPLINLLAEAGIDVESCDLIIKREIVANGRGKVFVNNQSCTLNLLKAIQPHIIDVHGQGEQQSLLSTITQTQLLDAYAGCEGLRFEVAGIYEQIGALAKALEDSRKSESERLQLLDLISYQINEIEQINPLLGEDVELESERRLLVNAEKLSTLSSEITQALYDDDDAVVARMGLVSRRMDELAVIHPQFQTQAEQLANSKYLLEDIVFAVRDFSEQISFSPARLQIIDDRLASLDRLKRKYGGSLSEVREHLATLQGRREELQHGDLHEKSLVAKLNESIRFYNDKAEKLSRLRRNAAKDLEVKLKKDISAVALEKARFMIHFNSVASGTSSLHLMQRFNELFQDARLGRGGNEAAEFFFTANKGEEPRPLHAVASGGELSRLMLILKTNIAPTAYPRTLVFDEIDTGIGGRVAEAVGVRLRNLSRSNQVICVTHQAQIARYADVHLQVTKDVKGQRTITKVIMLESNARLVELARMIAGANITDVTLQHAKELLDV